MASRVATELDQLYAQIEPAIRRIGYLRANIGDPNVTEKLDDSESGWALETAKWSIIECLIHFVYRCWQESKGSLTLPIVAKQLGKSSGVLEDKVKAFKQQSSFEAAHVLRVEWYGHLSADNSSVRRGFEHRGQQVPKLTLNELLDLSVQTVRLLADLRCQQVGVATPVDDLLAASEHQCRLFWEVLPKLREAERQ